MMRLVYFELKNFWVNHFGLVAIAFFLILIYLLLWIFPTTSYIEYGYAEPELYFEILSYLLLFVIPAFTTNMLSKEYSLGTIALYKAMQIKDHHFVLSKFLASLFLIFLLFALTVPHLYIIDSLGAQSTFTQYLGSYSGLILVGAIYASITLLISSIVRQAIVAFILSVLICFMLHWGVGLMSDMISNNTLNFFLDQLSLEYHTDQIRRGILRLSTVLYAVVIIVWSLVMTVYRIKTEEL